MWPASEERVITSYAAAVAVGVAVFIAGEALDAYLHPVQSDALPFGVTEAAFAFLTAFLLALVAALVPVLVGLAAFRSARVTHPAWFAAYGAATGLLLTDLFRDLAAGFVVPAVAGAAGGLTFRVAMGRQPEPGRVAEPRGSVPAMVVEPSPGPAHLTDLDAQAAYLSDALSSDDPGLVVLALKEIGTMRRIPVALDENPSLGEALRTVRELRLELEVRRVGSFSRNPPPRR